MHGTALFIDFFTVSEIDIPYFYPQFQIGDFHFFTIGIRKQYLAFLNLILSIVKNNKCRSRYLNLPGAIKILPPDHSGIAVADIKETAQRHISVFTRLLFIKEQFIMKYISHIISHCQINSIFQCNDFQLLCIFIIRPVHCIIKFQKFLSAIEDHTEYTIFVLTVYL